MMPSQIVDPRHSDATVIGRVLQGEVALFEVIMRRYNQRLFRTARAIVRDDDDAEDVLQEAYMQAYAHLGGFEGRSQLSTWLTRIVMNTAYRRLRQRRPTRELGEQDEPVMTNTPEDSLVGSELQGVLAEAIDTLPERFRIVFMLRSVQRLSVSETATCLGLREATVKTRLHRARHMLRANLEQAMELTFADVHRFLGERCNRVVAGVLDRLSA